MTNYLTEKNWKNKAGTGERVCKCGSWKQHWVNFSKKPWPSQCSVAGCMNAPTLGAHIINDDVKGEKIVPMCDSCNKKTGTFNLKDGISLVNANRSETCEK